MQRIERTERNRGACADDVVGVGFEELSQSDCGNPIDAIFFSFDRPKEVVACLNKKVQSTQKIGDF